MICYYYYYAMDNFSKSVLSVKHQEAACVRHKYFDGILHRRLEVEMQFFKKKIFIMSKRNSYASIVSTLRGEQPKNRGAIAVNPLNTELNPICL